MQKEIEKIVSGFSGNVLGIGITEEYIIKAINGNKKITICNLLSNQDSKKSKKGRTKYIYIKKIRKLFKKKKIDFIICNYEVIKNYLRSFVKDSVYINCGKLYFYGQSDEIKQLIIKYKRYNIKYKLIDVKKYYILEIDNKFSKNNWFKDLYYFFVDSVNAGIEFIGNLLMN